ncbi:hypothetical protein GCM10027405_25030 [Arthrobacter alkaliphilus]|uniref:hypothetical protein n=1 Tax=Arthrobacter alkaliphilus TaxID=369936 RepID=UPI001F43DB57|nr:hypothetical protein [Arthrobacter alkaliphilus]
MFSELTAAIVGFLLVFVGQIASTNAGDLFQREVGARLNFARSLAEDENPGGNGQSVAPTISLSVPEIMVDFVWATDIVQTTLTLVAGAPLAAIVLSGVFGLTDLLAILIAIVPLGAYLIIAGMDSNRYVSKSQCRVPLLGKISPGFKFCLVWYGLLLTFATVQLVLQLQSCQLSSPANESISLKIVLECHTK